MTSEELSETIDMLIKIFVGAGDSYSSWGTKVDMASQVIKETKNKNKNYIKGD